MQRVVCLLLAVACLVSAACTLSGERESTPTTTAVEPPPAPPSPDVERRIAVYSSVIRQLVTEDHTFGGADPGFKVVYVLDGSLKGAARTLLRERPPETPFSEQLKSGLRQALLDLPDLVFVRERLSVLRDCRVRNRGVLLTLGPIRGGERRVEVGSNLWVGCKGAIWLTYVVKNRAGRWAVTGITGSLAVS